MDSLKQIGQGVPVLAAAFLCHYNAYSLLSSQFWEKNQLKLQKKLSVKGVQQKYPISTLGKIAYKSLSRVSSLKRSYLYSLAKSTWNLRKSVVVVNISFQFPSKKSLNSGSAQAQIIPLKQFIIIIVAFVISAINLQGHVFSCARKKKHLGRHLSCTAIQYASRYSFTQKPGQIHESNFTDVILTSHLRTSSKVFSPGNVFIGLISQVITFKTFKKSLKNIRKIKFSNLLFCFLTRKQRKKLLKHFENHKKLSLNCYCIM